MSTKTVIGRCIYINTADMKDTVIRRIEEIFTFDNPEYKKRERMGLWLGNTDEKIKLYIRRWDCILVPYGFRETVLKYSDIFEDIAHVFENCVSARFDDGRVWFSPKERFDFGCNISLYDYQRPAVEAAVKKGFGVIVAPCGAGKTQIGLDLAARIGGRTLWLTHTKDLLNQSKNRAKDVFTGLTDDDFGEITGGEVRIGRVITFATVQTMSKIQLSDYRDVFTTVIVDECHHVCGSPTKLMMFWKVISELAAPFKYGLTATPKRSDGLTGCMFALLGSTAYEITQDAIKENTCPVSVKIRQTDYYPDDDEICNPDGTISYVKYIDDICGNSDRNDLIVDDVWGCVARGESCLVLTERVEHARILFEMLDKSGVPRFQMFAVNAKSKKDLREKAIAGMKDGSLKIMIATYALAKEGLDIPNLRNVFLTTPQKNDITVVQSVGRVSRKAEGKEVGIVWDYDDAAAPMIAGWTKKRRSIYRRKGYSIEE